MTQSTFSVRMDEKLKKQFEDLCEEFGMSMGTAINIFARAVVREKRIPFEIGIETQAEKEKMRLQAMEAFHDLREQAKKNGLSEMTMEEIDGEIAKSRQEHNK